MLDGILERVASVRDAAVVALDDYLARVKQDLTAAKRDLTPKLIRAVKDFPSPMDVLDKILEWVIPIKNADFERLANFLDTLPKDLDIHFTPISQDHKKSVQSEAETEEAEYEDYGVWEEDFGSGIQLGLGVVEALPLEVVRGVIEMEVVESVVRLEIVQDLFRNRPYCRQTIFTANSSKDIEGLPLFIYPRKGRSFYLEMARTYLHMARKMLAKAGAQGHRVRFIRNLRAPRAPCRRISLKPPSRCRKKKKTGSASQARLLHLAAPDGQNPNETQGICPEQRIIPDNELSFGAEEFTIQGISSGTTGDPVEGKPGQAMGQSISEVRDGTEVFNSGDGNWVDVPAVVEEAQASIEPIVVEEKEEVQSQVFLEKDEVIQQPDPQAMALTTEPAPDAKVIELWANLRAVGLAVEPLGDVPSVGVDVMDSWNAEEAGESLEPTISEEAGVAIKPNIAEGSGEPHLQVLSQQEEATQQSDPPATPLAHGPAPEEDLQAPGLVTEQLGAAPEVDVKGMDPSDMPATVEEAQVSLEQAANGEAEAGVEAMVTEGLEERRSQVSLHQEAIQQADPQTMAPACELAPTVNINELWANLLTAGLVTEPLGGVSNVDANIADIWDVQSHLTVPDGQNPNEIQGICPEQRIIPDNELGFGAEQFTIQGISSGTAGDPVEGNLGQQGATVPVTMEEAGAPLALTTEWPREHYPQAFFQPEGVIQQAGSQSFPLAHEEVPEANLDELWANLQAAGLIAGQSGNVVRAEAAGLDSTYSQARESPPYDNPVADLTRYRMPGFGNGGFAPVGFTFQAQEPAPMNSPVEFGGRVVPAFLFGDEHATVQENSPLPPPPPPPPRVVNLFDFTQPGQQRWGPSTEGNPFVFENPPQSPLAAPTPTEEESVRYCVVPGPKFVGFFGDTGGETSLNRREEEAETDEEDKIYWDDTMPEELRTSQGYYSSVPKAQTPMACPSFLFGSDSDITDFSDSELYELFQKEKDLLMEGGSKEGEQDSNKKEGEEDSDKKELQSHLTVPDGQNPNKTQGICPEQRIIRDNELGFGAERFTIQGISSGTTGDPVEGNLGQRGATVEEGGRGEEDKVRLAATTKTYPPTPIYYRDGFRSGGAGNAESDSDEIKWADSMPAHFSSPGYGRVSIPDKEKKKEPGFDEIKWADHMPAHFLAPDYGCVSVPGKVEKDAQETRGEYGYDEAEWAAATTLLQLADPQFFSNGLPEKEEAEGDEEMSMELEEFLESEMSKGEHEDKDEHEDEDEDEDGDEDEDEDEEEDEGEDEDEDEDEDEGEDEDDDEDEDGDEYGDEDEDEEGIEWESSMPGSPTLPFMPWGPPLRKPAWVGGGSERAPDLSQFDLDTGDLEEEENQRKKEKEKRLEKERKMSEMRRMRAR